MAQLERIRPIMEWRWGSDGEDKKEESRDDEEGSENGPRESHEEETLSFTSC